MSLLTEAFSEDIETGNTEQFSDFFIEEIQSDHLPYLYQRHDDLYNIRTSLSRLFSGSDARVSLKLFILIELINSTENNYWTIQELSDRFYFIRESQRQSLFKNLRDAHILEYDNYHLIYKLTDTALKIHSVLQVLEDSEEDDSTGILSTNLLQSEMLGKAPEKHLRPLLKKMADTIHRYDEALQLRSEDKISSNLNELKEMLDIHDLASEAIRKIRENTGDEITREVHELTQEIGNKQSVLSGFSVKMERALNQIERQRINLTEMGVGIHKIEEELKKRSLEKLAALSAPLLKHTIRPLFMNNQFIDEAEFELFSEKFSAEEELSIAPRDNESTQVFEKDRLVFCEALNDLVSEIETEQGFLHLIEHVKWEEKCYRMSMLGLLNTSSENGDIIDDPIAQFRQQPFEIQKKDVEKVYFQENILKSGNSYIWQQESETYKHEDLRPFGISYLSKGKIKRLIK